MIKLIDRLKLEGVEVPKKTIIPLSKDIQKITNNKTTLDLTVKLAKATGFNQCKALYDNLEVVGSLERLDFNKVLSLMVETNRIYQQQHPGFQAGYSQLADALYQKFGTPKIDEGKIADKFMYDFPKHYSNTQIIEYQRLITKVVKAIKKLSLEG